MADQGPFRGFSQQQLQSLQGQSSGPAQSQAQQQAGPTAPQRNWRYANRNPPSAAPYAQFSSFQTDYKQSIYNPNKARPDETQMMLDRKLHEREQQMQIFEQKWQAQRNGSDISGDHIIREGIWARSPEYATQHVPWPIHAKEWRGENPFLENLEVLEGFLANKKIFFKDGITCLVKDCGAQLQNAEFLDEVNKVAWPVSFIHYLGDHNNPPSKFFYDYVNRAAAAIRGMHGH